MNPRTVLVRLVVALVTVFLPTASASVPVGEPSSDGDLRGIRESLERLVALEEAGARRADVELVLRRIELEVRRLEPLERLSTLTEAEIRRGEESLASLERYREQQEALLEQEIREGLDDPRSETRRSLDDLRRSRAGLEERLESARARLLRHENDLARAEDRIEDLDDMLEELLDR